MSGTALALVLAAAVLHATWNLAVKGATGEDGVAFVWVYVVLSAAIWVPIGVVWVVVAGDRPTWSWVIGPVGTGTPAHRLPARPAARVRRGRPQPGLPAGPGCRPDDHVRRRRDRARPASRCPVRWPVWSRWWRGVVLISFAGRASRLAQDRAGMVWGLATGARSRRTRSGTTGPSTASTSRRCRTSSSASSSSCRSWPCCSPAAATRRRCVTSGRPRDGRPLWSRSSRRWPTSSCCAPCSSPRWPWSPPARESSIVIGAVFGWLVLREPRPARRLVGAVVVLVGIGLIAVG